MRDRSSLVITVTNGYLHLRRCIVTILMTATVSLKRLGNVAEWLAIVHKYVCTCVTYYVCVCIDVFRDRSSLFVQLK